MKRRSLLKGIISSLLTGPSIVKAMEGGGLVKMAEDTGFLNLENLKKLVLIGPRHRAHAEEGVPTGWGLLGEDGKVEHLAKTIDVTALSLVPTAICFDGDGSTHLFKPGTPMFDYAVKHSMDRFCIGEPNYRYGGSLTVDIDGVGQAVHHSLTPRGRSQLALPLYRGLRNYERPLHIELGSEVVASRFSGIDWQWAEPRVKSLEAGVELIDDMF